VNSAQDPSEASDTLVDKLWTKVQEEYDGFMALRAKRFKPNLYITATSMLHDKGCEITGEHGEAIEDLRTSFLKQYTAAQAEFKEKINDALTAFKDGCAKLE
jgi:hypothetical protein